MHSLQGSQLDIEIESWKIKISPTDSIIWLNIGEYFKGPFIGDSLYNEKKLIWNTEWRDIEDIIDLLWNDF